MSLLIHRSLAKAKVLEYAENTRAHKFTRVSADVFDHLHMVVLREIEKIVRAQPSKGCTVAMGTKHRKSTEEAEHAL